MSVQIHRQNWSYKEAPLCLFCGGWLHPPYVQWTLLDTEDQSSVFFCRDCCEKSGRGLMADFIQIRAIREMQRLGYHGETLERCSIKKDPLPTTARRVVPLKDGA